VNSHELARRLLEREAAWSNDVQPKLAAAAVQRACTRVVEALCDSMGNDGCDALLARALFRTEAKHPALKDLRRISNGKIHLDGVAASVEAHGEAKVTAAVEALLGAVIDVLGRLIGEDMAIRIIDPDNSQNARGAKSP
jgi:hypothetical protein